MRVRITDPAKADLNEIRLYLHSQSPNAAQKMGRRLREACLSLADFPNRNRLGSVPGARENVTVWPYIIVYRITDVDVQMRHTSMIGFILAALLEQADMRPLQKADVDRPVAGIISPIWSDPAHRDAAHEVDQIVGRLRLHAGSRVADIGAGSGYDTLRLAKVVGPRGRILAEDITPAYLQQLRRTVGAAALDNVDIIQGDPGDPKLPPHSIDAAIMVHMYHEIQQPLAMLAKLAAALGPGGRLGIEELDRPTQAHGTPPKLLVCELAAAGYRLIELKPLKGDIGYFAIFSAPGAVMPEAASTARRCRA